ncbi:hypothetical protein [Cellulomonas sp. C5510]|uniref:hypothetical protein n=1 Tax=Cellulomonas sp. C5510 TaxID=2871170 RepID=UPI001C970DD6|nr:hypothetical protein [Cellulomonas sp. C5510]QZN86516.1 hypothetical protein K5O09_05020 [Cellulomonas sp. C5510]
MSATPPADGPDARPAADAGSDWRSRRREAADAHEAALRARRQAESARARELIAAFVAEATARGVAPEPLQAQGYGGRGRFRTPLRGWYLRRDRTVAVGTDGGFYVLTVPPSIGARLRGVQPEPQDPPLVLGAGGKDGESLDLPVALARALGDAPGPV